MAEPSSPQHPSPGCALDARFPTYSPGSRRLYEFTEAGERGLLLAEIRRTLDGLATAAPALIAKGTLTEAQSREVMFLWLAIANDLEAEAQWTIEFRAARDSGDGPQWTVADRIAARGDGYAWAAKVEALRREIAHRRTGQEAEIQKGRLTAADAKAQLERLEAVHDLYWRCGFTFDGTRDELRQRSNAILDFDVEQDGAAKVEPRQEQAA